jgi:hypothetical protein
MTKQKTIEQKWHEQSEAAKQEANKLPYGKTKSELLRKARQLETALPDQPLAIIARPTAAHIA